MTQQQSPPTELGQYVLRLLREFRDKAELVMVLEVIANGREILTSQAEVNSIRERLHPIIAGTFKESETNLINGTDPLIVLKEFFSHS